MIASCIRQLCALSIFCGAAMSMAPEGSVKRVMGVLCSAALILAVIQPLKGMDLSQYALELAKYEEREAEFLEGGEDMNDRLNRLVIQEGYETYIKDKATELGIEMRSVSVSAQWNMDGLWVPESVELDGEGAGESKRELSRIIEAELGIPAERQYWSENE